MLQRGTRLQPDVGSPMLNSLDQFLATRVSALDLRAHRSELLASNVANADTPNYKARDFDFTQALQIGARWASQQQWRAASGAHFARTSCRGRQVEPATPT